MESLENDRREQNLSHPVVMPIHVRCPDCFKQFSVNPQEIVEPKPKFQCTDCETQFWIAYPEVLEQKEVIGFPVSWLDTSSQKEIEKSALAVDQISSESDLSNDTTSYIPGSQLSLDFSESLPLVQETAETKGVSSAFDAAHTLSLEEEGEVTASKEPQLALEVERQFPCPKCKKNNTGGVRECRHCGVVIKVFEERAEYAEQFPLCKEVSSELKFYWERVLDKYEDKDIHQQFLNRAISEGQMQFALTNYKNMLAANGSDEIALAMQNQIVVLTVQKCVGTGAGEGITSRDKDQVKKTMVYRSIFSIANVIVIISTALIAIGYFIPSLRNLMGIGVSVLFIALALRYHFKLI